MVYKSGSGWASAVEFTNTVYTDWPLINALGSGLSAANYPETAPNGIRVYYQDPSGYLNWWSGEAVDTSSEAWATGKQPIYVAMSGIERF